MSSRDYREPYSNPRDEEQSQDFSERRSLTNDGTVHPEFRKNKFSSLTFRFPWIWILLVVVLTMGTGIAILRYDWTFDNTGRFQAEGEEKSDEFELAQQVGQPFYDQDEQVEERTIMASVESVFFTKPSYFDDEPVNVLTPEVIKLVKEATDIMKEDYEDWCLRVAQVQQQAPSQDAQGGAEGNSANEEATEYKCAQILSITELADFNFDDEGNTTQSDIDRAIDSFSQSASEDELAILGNNFDQSARSARAIQISFRYGFPLEGFTNPDQREEECDEPNARGLCGPKTNEDGLTQQNLLQQQIGTAYYQEISRMRQENDGNVFIALVGQSFTQNEFNSLLGRDMMFLGLAAVFILILIGIFTKSCLIAIASLIQFACGFVITLFVWFYLFGYTVLVFLQLLSVFVILAIGADGVFIFLDTWKRAPKLYPVLLYYPERRMAWTFRHAAFSVLVTSITTSVAFFAIASSSIVTMRSIGIFAGTFVIVNYLVMLLMTPAIITIWHKCGADVLCCCCCRGCPCCPSKPNDHPTRMTKNSIPMPLPGVNDYVAPRKDIPWNVIERQFSDKVAPAIYKARWILIGLSVVLLATGIGLSTQLGPQDEASDFVAEDDPLNRGFDLSDEEFNDTTPNQVTFYWGVDRLDRTGIDPNDSQTQGDVIYDDDFDATNEAFQEYIVDVCELMQDNEWDELVNTSNNNVNGVRCFMKQMIDWCEDTEDQACTAFPFGNAINNIAPKFLADSRTKFGGGQNDDELNMRSLLGYDPNEERIRWWSVAIYATFTIEDGSAKAESLMDDYDRLEDVVNDGRPEGAVEAFQTTRSWSIVETNNDLLQGVILGILISIAVAFSIILLMTGNILIAFVSMTSIGMVITTLLAIVWMMGWALGTFESISLQILVGLAIDYVVHFAVGYITADENSALSNKEIRIYKATQALASIGVSVLAGAVTTIITFGVMIFTRMLLFKQFGIIVTISSVFSFIYTHICFVAAMFIFGPVRHQWNVFHAAKRLLGRA